MTLLGALYHLDHVTPAGESITGAVTLDPLHAIFRGHFPGSPVLPGVCMMQMIKEIFEHATGKSTRIAKADSLKFLRVIDPVMHPVLTFAINYRLQANGSFFMSAELLAGEAVCFKMKASFSQQ